MAAKAKERSLQSQDFQVDKRPLLPIFLAWHNMYTYTLPEADPSRATDVYV
jgi:hypothetical protein